MVATTVAANSLGNFVTAAMTTTAILEASLEAMTASFVVGGNAALRHREPRRAELCRGRPGL
jgi:hypothetical protein